MLKKELRGRKLKTTRSMDAEERFHNKRMGNVKYCIHMKHNVPLESITANWTMKYVSIKGQIVVKEDSAKWKPEIHQIPRRGSRSRRTNAEMAVKKLIATTVSSREKGMKRREEGWTMSSQKTITTQRNHSNERCTSEGGGRDKLKKVVGDFPTCMRKIETIMEDNSSIAPLMEMYRCVCGKLRRKATTTAAAARERSVKKMKAEAAH